MKTIVLTSEAEDSLNHLHSFLPHIDPVFLVETALKLTENLYEKAEDGATIEVSWPGGKTEALRFLGKKVAKGTSKRKVKTEA